MIKFNNNWDELLKNEWQQEYYINLKQKLKYEYYKYTVYPNMFDIYNALKITDYNNVKVIILGQDPYHNVDQAHGLSFSVKFGTKKPPSLINIFKELKNDLNIDNNNGNLLNWGKEGVLLLNTILTVRANSPNSHKNIGWNFFTDNIIKLINKKNKPVVFILWGNQAYQKKSLITNNKHLILNTYHPSPLSAHKGFFGCKHFSKTNNFLLKYGYKPINWQT